MRRRFGLPTRGQAQRDRASAASLEVIDDIDLDVDFLGGRGERNNRVAVGKKLRISAAQPPPVGGSTNGVIEAATVML